MFIHRHEWNSGWGRRGRIYLPFIWKPGASWQSTVPLVQGLQGSSRLRENRHFYRWKYVITKIIILCSGPMDLTVKFLCILPIVKDVIIILYFNNNLRIMLTSIPAFISINKCSTSMSMLCCPPPIGNRCLLDIHISHKRHIDTVPICTCVYTTETPQRFHCSNWHALQHTTTNIKIV